MRRGARRCCSSGPRWKDRKFLPPGAIAPTTTGWRRFIGVPWQQCSFWPYGGPLTAVVGATPGGLAWERGHPGRFRSGRDARAPSSPGPERAGNRQRASKLELLVPWRATLTWLLSTTLGLLPASGSMAASGPDLGFALLRLFAQQQPGETVVVSPASIEVALTLLAAGAAGETQRELHTLAGDAALALLQGLRAAPLPAAVHDAGRRTMVSVGNCLWAPPHLPFSDVFAQRAQRDLAAVALSSAAASAPALLNAWMARTTGGLIPRILDKPPDPTSLVLANGIVFLGTWKVPFDPTLTTARPFHEASGHVRQAPMMARAGHFRYAVVPGGQLLELPYDETHYSFRVFLPEATQDLDAWLAQTHASAWLALGASLQETAGELVMPRLDLAFAAELKPALERLGVVAAFRPGVADFSAMTAAHVPFAVGSIMHRTVVQVDESGTKAAAATTVHMTGAAVPEMPFRMLVDRPFLFTIHSTDPDALLFLGLVRAW